MKSWYFYRFLILLEIFHYNNIGSSQHCCKKHFFFIIFFFNKWINEMSSGSSRNLVATRGERRGILPVFLNENRRKMLASKNIRKSGEEIKLIESMCGKLPPSKSAHCLFLNSTWKTMRWGRKAHSTSLSSKKFYFPISICNHQKDPVPPAGCFFPPCCFSWKFSWLSPEILW